MTLEKIGCKLFLPPLTESRQVAIDYDKEEDVLYINYLSKYRTADDATQFGDYILRFIKNRVVGVTIINALKHIATDFADAPEIFQDKKLIYA